jgi:predicted RNA-binding Zn ribbon-like protein
VQHAFPCGTLSLDFVGTLRARRNSDPKEKLLSTGNLDAWFMESGLMDSTPRSKPADLVAAVELREAIYSLVDAKINGAKMRAQATAVVNRFAAEVPMRVQLSAAGSVNRRGTPAEGLAVIARDAIEVIGGDHAALLRECSRPECTQVYVDQSHGHRRDWCSMRTCGNRMKASGFRQRHRNPDLEANPSSPGAKSKSSAPN